jgi:cytochrome c-type biogenesis protein
MHIDPSVLTLVLTAGAVALLSPCGYPMLPGYVAYYLGTTRSFSRSILGGVACTIGLLSIFLVFGIAVSVVGSLVYPYIPYFELVSGLMVMVLGIAMLANLQFHIPSLSVRITKHRGILGLYCYGLLYGLATMSCTAPIFITILFMALSTGGILTGMIIYTVYGVGMGIPLVVTTILVHKAKDYLDYTIKRMVGYTRWFNVVGGLVLIAIGVYLVIYYFDTVA